MIRKSSLFLGEMKGGEDMAKRQAVVVGLLLLAQMGFASQRASLAQPKPFSIPQDSVQQFFQVIFVPSIQGPIPSEAQLLGFYNTYVSIHSQVKVAEDQWVIYWQKFAREAGRLKAWLTFFGGSMGVAYNISDEPIYNETRDQARFKVTVELTTAVGRSTMPRQNMVYFVHTFLEGGVYAVRVCPPASGKRLCKAPVSMTIMRA